MARLADSNTRFVQTMQGKHLNHALNVNKRWWRERLRHYFGYDVWKLPVCERCEGYALWHKQGDKAVGACQCGHITVNPITVEQYYEQGHHVDKTALGRDVPIIVDRTCVKPKDVATYNMSEVGGENVEAKIIIPGRM